MKNLLIILLILSADFVNAQSLEQYVKMALGNSSAIKNKVVDEQIARLKIDEAHTFPDTQLDFGVYALQPETRVGNQQWKAGVSQQIPWFGTNKAKENWLARMSDLKKYDTDLAKRQLAYRVKELFYQMFEKQRLIFILKENKQILKTYEDMALGALENNRTTMTEVLKIRARKNELHAKIYKAVQDLDRLQRQFNRLLERKEDLPVRLPVKLDPTEILISEAGVDNFPSLQKIKESKAVFVAERKWTEKKKLPKIKFGLDYIPVSPRTDMAVFNNGKDILMPKIGLSIPIFNRANRSQIEQAKLKEQQTEWAYTEQKIRLENLLDKLHTDFQNEMVILMAAEKNIKETQLAIDVSLKGYETAMLDYDKILRLQLDKIQFQLKALEATVQAFLIKARIDFLTK